MPFLNEYAPMYHDIDALLMLMLTLMLINFVTMLILVTILMTMLPLLFRCSKVLADGSSPPIIATTHQFISTQCMLPVWKQH